MKHNLRTKLYDKRYDLIFPLFNFPFICCNIPEAPAYGVSISQLIHYSWACVSYHYFLDIGLLLTTKPLNQRSFWKLYGHFHDLVNNYNVIDHHGYIPLVTVTIPSSFPLSWFVAKFLTWLTQWVLHVEQELLTFPEHLSSPALFNGVHVAQY